MFKKKVKSIKEMENKNINPEKKIELLKGVIAEKDKMIEKYKKINGEIEITQEDDLIFTLEKCKKDQEELLKELKQYKKEYADLIQKQKTFNDEFRKQLGI